MNTFDDSRAAGTAADHYDFRMTPYLESLLAGRAADDPLARQFLPDARELTTTAHELTDPIGDDAHSPSPGLVHRYPDRVLLKVAHACPVYCRFCFRREMIGHKGKAMSAAELDAAVRYIGERPGIWEAILTGGDPLSLSRRRMDHVLGRLDAIAHLGIVRIHTRVPIVAPQVIDDRYVDAFKRDKPIYLVVHVNHADELTDAARGALRRLHHAGVTLLSQSVLLQGVNDDAEVLATLFKSLATLRVRPYYLHHPDLAPGTGHFRVSLEQGQAIMHSLRGRISGHCLPTYVLDIPGGFGKVPIGAEHIGAPRVDGSRDVTDRRGRIHHYPL